MRLPRAAVFVVASLANKITPSVYYGSLYGVRVQVALHELPNKEHAQIKLQGIPVGGNLEGNATFDENNNVVMDPLLHRALSLRRVSLLSVTRDTTTNTLSVNVQLPFLGKRTVTLEPRVCILDRQA
jgi:hypothetical protein